MIKAKDVVVVRRRTTSERRARLVHLLAVLADKPDEALAVDATIEGRK